MRALDLRTLFATDADRGTRFVVEAAGLNLPAVRSGHTHGGQVVIPGVGRPAGRRFPDLAGLGSRDETSIFVSRGVGTVYVPMRINCPPEVALITLRAVGLRMRVEAA
jgi:hypothetical protein